MLLILAFAALWSPVAPSPIEQQVGGVAMQGESHASKTCPSPKEIDSILSRASSLMSDEQYQDAAQVLQASHLSRCDPRVALLLGAALEGKGDKAEAQATLREAHRAWPSNSSIATSLAREYLLGGKDEEASLALSTTPVGMKTPLQELQLRIDVYLANHELVLAQSVARLTYKAYPSESCLLQLANVIQLQGRSQDVVSLLQEKRKDYAGSPPFLITLAESEYDAGSFANASKDLVRAVALDGSSYQAHYLLGNTLIKQTKTDQAIAEYRIAIELAPEQPRTYYQLARALAAQSNLTGAEQSLLDAIKADEGYAPAYCEMGELLIQEERFPEAIAPLLKAIEYNPKLNSAYYLLVRVYSRLGEKQASQDMLHRYLLVKEANRKKPVMEDEARSTKEDRVPPGGGLPN